jgi:hypothetical protein
MRCQKVRFFLSAFCKRELPEKRRKAISAHLKVCPECRREEALCREIEGSVGKLKDFSVTEDFNARLLQRVSKDRFEESKTKAYHPKKAPLFVWSRIIPVAATACLVLAFVFSGGLDILYQKDEPIVVSQFDNQDANLDNRYMNVQPEDNPNLRRQNNLPSTDSQPGSQHVFAQHASSGWAFKRELARATRIRNLLNNLAAQNGFNVQSSRLASILTHPEGQSIVMRRPFGGQVFNGFESTGSFTGTSR